jgi:hypothetical protein
MPQGVDMDYTSKGSGDTVFACCACKVLFIFSRSTSGTAAGLLLQKQQLRSVCARMVRVGGGTWSRMSLQQHLAQKQSLLLLVFQ